MKLTRLQRKVLKVWWRYRTDGMGVGPWLRQCLRSWLLLGGLCAYSYFFIVPYAPAVGWSFIGLCLGACLRDVGYYQMSRRAWPVTKEVIDWKRVSDMMESPDDTPPGSPSAPSRLEPGV